MKLRPWIVAAAVCALGCSDEPDETKNDPPASDPGEIVASQIDIDGMVFDTRVTGPEDGALVLLLHGFPQTSYEWRAELKALGEAGYRAVAPNQRGYSAGARPTEVSDYAVPLLVNDVVEMADALGHDRFHVVGHDWGAAVTWGVAIAAAERVISMTSVSIPHPDAFNEELSDPMSCQSAASSYFEIFSMDDSEDLFLDNDAALLRSLYEELTADAVEDYLSVLGTKEALSAALNWYRANVAGGMLGPMVGPVSVPTLFIWSDGDTAICREGADATQDHVTGPYQFEVIEGVSHWVPELASDRVSELLTDHLSAQ